MKTTNFHTGNRGLATYVLWLCIFATTLVACSKKGSVSNNSSCKITSYKDLGNNNNPVITNITYNNDGQVSAIQSTLQSSNSNLYSAVFTYVNNNLVLVTRTQDGQFSEFDSIKLNNNGAVSYKYSLLDGNAIYRETFSYAANGAIQSKIENITQAGGFIDPPDTLAYQYTNGDLTSVSKDNTPIETYTYYDAKANETGDAYQMEQLSRYGTVFPKNAHLLKSSDVFGNVNHTVDNYSYSFDSNGKIAEVTTTSDNSILNETYGYSCN